MRPRHTIWWFFIILCMRGNAQEQKEHAFQFRGYVKDLQTFTFAGGFDSTDWVQMVHNRLNFSYRFSETWSARMEIRNRIFVGSQVEETPGFGENIDAYPGYFDLSKTWVDTGAWVVHSVIDRLSVKYASGKWELVAGRQRINWGVNNIWNPNDIFNAYNFLDFDYEERPGNDAVRVQYFPSGSTSIDFAYRPGRKTGESIAALRYGFNRKNYDWQVIAGLYQRDVMVGAGWAGSIGKTGFKGEFSYFHPTQDWTDTLGAVSFSWMADQTFKNDWYLGFSYLYNSQPVAYSGGGIFTSNLSAKSLFPFRHSFYTGANKRFNPAWQGSMAVIYSPTNHTLILFPVLAYNVSSQWDIDLTMQAFFAEGKNGYGSQGSAVFLRAKWSF
ncbi:MAG: hypothetical protein MUE58_07550 [Chitinophagaceae bacterium]|jgi:hypothetical protein|nr:hypothetical protein [Chitinophagaceae bacterium]